MRHLFLIAVAVASPVAAEVKSAAPAGFAVESRVVVAAAPAETYAQIVRIDQWWDAAHSYSGKAANLTLDARAGGCFCERLADGGGVEHMRVVSARPGVELRLQGGLGPLQAEAVTGSLSWSLKPAGGGTEIVQRYVVGGYVEGGADRIAPAVDQVLAGQLLRLQQKLAR
jgi:uncharacterized protein YndB with AHSA1/START domain